MESFQLNDKVSFVSNSGKELEGVIVKINPQTYKIKIGVGPKGKDEHRWVTKRVKAHNLKKVSE